MSLTLYRETPCEHGRIGACGVTMYCRDLDRHVKADYDSHECETWWFCPGGTRVKSAGFTGTFASENTPKD